jgi:hemerythrin-like domain-containing protein
MFPRLRERLDGARDQAVLDVLDEVEADHLEMAGLWRLLDRALADISRGQRVPVDPELIDRFAKMYRHHIDAEERVLLPALKRVLTASEWQAVGKAMAERRGLDWEQVAQPARKGPTPG